MADTGNELVVTVGSVVIPQQAESDEHLIGLWLHGRSAGTMRAYQEDVRGFLSHCSKPFRSITLGDVQAYSDVLAEKDIGTGDKVRKLSTASRARSLSSVKSLLTFAHRIGYVTFNVGAPVRLPKIKETLAERIMDEAVVHKMLALETNARNGVMLRLLYGAGLRISEVCGLKWRDLKAADDAGQMTVFGKGGKTRYVRLPAGLWAALASLQDDAGPDAPVFVSQRKGHLDPSGVHRVVKAAAARAGLSDDVSAHWLRHAHASHALDRGAPIHLVQATLGHASVATTGRYSHAKASVSSALYLAV